MIRTMFAANVYDAQGYAVGITGMRVIKPTLEEATAVLDQERRRGNHSALDWRREFDGATAKAGPLVYEVTPVQVDLPAVPTPKTPLMVSCAAGRRGAGSIDCIVCSEKIHQRPHPGFMSPTDPWFDGAGDNEVGGSLDGQLMAHRHRPAKEIGPVLGPFEYVDVTYQSVRVDEGEVLAVWDDRRGDWVLTELAGEAAGEAYSDLTIHPKGD